MGRSNRLRIAILVGALLPFLASACGDRPESVQNEQPGPEGHAAVEWGYEGAIGPDHWAHLSPEFALCGEGTEQSPIDLTNAEPIEDEIDRVFGDTVLTVEQRATVMDLVDNGHTIQVTNDVAVALDLAGSRYELVQYHFHAPSEHTINGQHAPLEVHFVHKSADGALAVAGILVEEGEHDPIWDPILVSLPSGPGDTRHVEGPDLDPNEFRPLPKHYFRYRGSLTTPPCSEGVEWVVMAELRQISPEQMQSLVSHLHHNNRPVQPLGDRALGVAGM
jgi:carbonic anhydrase